MCSPASFILTKDNVFWSMKTDSHESIIEEHKLRADGAGNRANVLRVEITPHDNDFGKPAAEWEYRIDQDVLPVWHDAEADEKRARKALGEWIKARVFTGGEHSISDGAYFAWGNASVEAGDNASVEAGGNASVEAGDNASVKAGDNASVKAWDNASVKAWGNASVKAWGNASVEAWGNASVEAGGNANVSIGRFYCDGAKVHLTELAACIDRRSGKPVLMTAETQR